MEEEFTSDQIPTELHDELKSSFGSVRIDLVADYDDDDPNKPQVNQSWRSFKSETQKTDQHRTNQKVLNPETFEFEDQKGYKSYSYKVRIEFPDDEEPILRQVTGFETFIPEK